MIVRKCDIKVGNWHCRILGLTPKAEHFCVGLYATCETIGAHAAMWWVSVVLAVAVAGSFIYEKLADAGTA